MKKKIVAFILVFALALALGIGGTMAWLTATSGQVVNTFTVGDIEISLTESGIDANGAKGFEVVPGWNYAKDPTIAITEGSEACWVFVTIDVENNGDDDQTYIEWAVRDGWVEIEDADYDYVYYYNQIIDASKGEVDPLYVLSAGEGEFANGYVTANGENVTKEFSKAIADGDVDAPVMTFKAYAMQSSKNNTTNFTPAEAWAEVKPAPAVDGE